MLAGSLGSQAVSLTESLACCPVKMYYTYNNSTRDAPPGMTPEIILLAFSAAAIAFVHTILGPDQYLPFVAMAKARQWSMSKTLRITLMCGTGHLAGSVALGLKAVNLGRFERYNHAVAGSAVLVCGLSVAILGI